MAEQSTGSARPFRLRVRGLPQQIALRAQRSFAPEVLTSVRRYYDLMCQSRRLSPTSLLHSLVSLGSLDQPLLVIRTFPTFTTANPSLDAWTFTPAVSVVLLPVSSY